MIRRQSSLQGPGTQRHTPTTEQVTLAIPHHGEDPIKPPCTSAAGSPSPRYKSYMGTAFTFAATCLWRSGLILTGFFNLELSHLFTLREFAIVALTCAVSELFGLQLIWVVSGDCRSALKVVTSLQSPKTTLLVCCCCPQRAD